MATRANARVVLDVLQLELSVPGGGPAYLDDAALDHLDANDFAAKAAAAAADAIAKLADSFGVAGLAVRLRR